MLVRTLAAAMRPLCALASVAVWFEAAAQQHPYAYDEPGDRRFMTNTQVLERWSPDGGDNRSFKIASPRAGAAANFTTEAVVIDGIREAAWDRAEAHAIDHVFDSQMSNTGAGAGAGASGSLRMLWDGPVLYLLVEVRGDATPSDSQTPEWSRGSYAPETDGLLVYLDVFNDQWGIETDTQGVIFLGANPALSSATSFNNRSIPSLGSFFNEDNQDYSGRLKAFASSGYRFAGGINYTYEVALQIEGWGDAWQRELTNGTQVGLEVAVVDAGNTFAYWSKTEAFAGREGGSNLPNSERVRNRDWGVVTLSGWDGESPQAYSGWRAEEDIRFWNSASNPGGSGNGTAASDNGDDSAVWTEDSRDRMIAAKAAYMALPDNASPAAREAAVLEVCRAFAALRWADTHYPDPQDLPAIYTLPDVWTFFDETRGDEGRVTNAEQWAERKQEILELAQFYEYGYKPRLGDDYAISLIENSYDGSGAPQVTARVTPANRRFNGGVPQEVSIELTLPANSTDGRKAPISFGGNWTDIGIASVRFPYWARDDRSNAGAWGDPNRAGIYYALFPYERNSTSADSSILIANAAAVSIHLDILEMAVAQNPRLDERIDPTRAVTRGFSIGGKMAFVAAVFDERVKIVVNGGSGATGPANWRYNAQGQEYDFTDTEFYKPGAGHVIAHGTEGPGNSYRHNRVRETELFRHFMPYGHMYAHEDGAYNYGGYSRLPFDQTSLLATLAPDRAILINTNLNDFNDGAATDNMSLQIARSVYRVLGVNPDDFVKFNSGAYVSNGDPHGAAGPELEAKYISDFFFGTATLSEEEAERLNTDPYALPVTNGRTQSAYDYYWGGYNTITGGSGGVNGRDGWYYYEFR